MNEINIQPSMSGPSAAVLLDRLRGGARAASKTSTLSPEALAVAAMPTPAPISPIVLAGFVRMAEFALIVLVGVAIFAVYLPSGEGLIWRYLAAIIAIATLSMLAFQTADIYQVQAFRGHEKHMRSRPPGRWCSGSSSAHRSSPKPASCSRVSGSAPSLSAA
jgi:hypothetical protein